MNDEGGRIIVLGCGFSGVAVALAARSLGRTVLATTRRGERALELEALGIPSAVCQLADGLGDLISAGDRVAVTFPPDGKTDRVVAEALRKAARVAYVSSTGVYGDARGRIDGATPTPPTTVRIATRLAAERAYLDIGGIVLRAPGIYGRGRGLHQRLASGRFRLPGDGGQVVSRIHVDDLAAFVIAALDRGDPRDVLAVGDDAPVPQREVVEWLCKELGLPFPQSAPLEEVDETLRHDRRVDGSIAKAKLAVTLRYPTYVEGFRASMSGSDLRPSP